MIGFYFYRIGILGVKGKLRLIIFYIWGYRGFLEKYWKCSGNCLVFFRGVCFVYEVLCDCNIS